MACVKKKITQTRIGKVPRPYIWDAIADRHASTHKLFVARVSYSVACRIYYSCDGGTNLPIILNSTEYW